MQKIVALVLLRALPRGGKHFRRWFAMRVCTQLRTQQLQEALQFHDAQIPEVYVDTIRRNTLFQLQFSVPLSTHRVCRWQNVRLRRLINRSGYTHWEWQKVPLQQGF